MLLSSRHPRRLRELAQRRGPNARAGTPREASEFGDAVLISVPHGALHHVGRDYAAELRGKIVLDTGNPFPHRDGDMAVAAHENGTAVASDEFLAGVRLVRAFNTIPCCDLREPARRAASRSSSDGR